MKTRQFFVYILRCADTSLYTGATKDLSRRLAQHNLGKGAKYTKSRRPCTLVYHESFATWHEALAREWFIKHKMTRAAKADLIAQYSPAPHDKDCQRPQRSAEANG